MQNKVIFHYKLFIIGDIILSIFFGTLIIINPTWVSRNYSIMIIILSISGALGMNLNLINYKKEQLSLNKHENKNQQEEYDYYVKIPKGDVNIIKCSLVNECEYLKNLKCNKKYCGNANMKCPNNPKHCEWYLAKTDKKASPPLELKLEDVIKRIEQYVELEKNWNGQDANPFSKKLINKSINLVKQMTPIPKVFPTGRESIQLEWEVDGLHLEIEVYEDKIEIYNEFKKDGITISIGES